MKRVIIAAVAENGVVGKENKIPWRIPNELRFFRETTMGFPVLMGRKTFESIGKILDGRTNIILSKTLKRSVVAGARVFADFETSEKFIEKLNAEKYFIIGGASVFNQFINSADELIISKIKGAYEGDVFFPEISDSFWKEIKKIEFEDFAVLKYLKR
ncbi:MAG: dihydrofolate reductase [Chlorobi bacterium]|nr:dihydrofolate reductase [Chlorobiota bacterium]